jgi:hypothetical protein
MITTAFSPVAYSPAQAQRTQLAPPPPQAFGSIWNIVNTSSELEAFKSACVTALEEMETDAEFRWVPAKKKSDNTPYFNVAVDVSTNEQERNLSKKLLESSFFHQITTPYSSARPERKSLTKNATTTGQEYKVRIGYGN